MGSKGTEQDSLRLIDVPPDKLRRGANGRMVDAPTPDVYELRLRKDKDGFDLISDHFRRGPIWYAGPDAVRHAVAFARYRSRSRSRQAIIHVLDAGGAVIETYKPSGDFRQ
jgi:hypothetical protein